MKCKLFCFPTLALIILCSSCESDSAIPDLKPVSLEIPDGFPEPKIPKNNPVTEAKIKLGKALFHENILSKDSSISCATCHIQQFSFSDPNNIALGINGIEGIRNVLPLINLAWENSFFRDGGVQSLELVALNAIHSEKEFNTSAKEIEDRLKESAEYNSLFRQAFNDTISVNNILFALSTFQRSLISGDSQFDKYFFQGQDDALNESQKRGLDLFFSDRTNCSSCHSGINFNSKTFEANGLFEAYPDSGRQRITLNEVDRAKFKVPNLRNVELTAPYMHNGEVNTLAEVIDLYNEGGYEITNKSEFIRPLGLSEDEKQDLISFLKSLTDITFVNNTKFQPDTE